MSFPKAKLQRFNEIQNPTPSPAEYNVLLKSHVSGAVLPKSERFAELRSPASSDNSSFVSNNGQPLFKTPNKPMKKSNSIRKVKPINLFSAADNLEALNEKIVECNNKDVYIQELTDQLEEMKQELNDLQNCISALKLDKGTLETNLEKLDEDHKMTISSLKIKYEDEMKVVTTKLSEVNTIIDLMTKQCKDLKLENKKNLTNVLQNIETLKKLLDSLNTHYNMLVEELKTKENEIYKLQKTMDELKDTHIQNIDELKETHQKEIQILESDILKTVTNMHNLIDCEKENNDKHLKDSENSHQIEIDNLKQKFKEETSKLVKNFESEIRQMEENHNKATLLAEIQTKEKCKAIEFDWNVKLCEARAESDAILKECQAIAEYNVIQCEIEKNKATFELTEEKKKVDQLQVEIAKIKTEQDYSVIKQRNLQAEFSSVIVELNNVRELRSKELHEYEATINQTTRDKHLYELTISKTHKTIEALKNRLMKSDRDVEQLKAELEATEESKVEVEGKCNHLMEELDIVTNLCEVIEIENELAIKEAKEKAMKLEEELLNKVDCFKMQTDETIKSKDTELEKSKKELREFEQHLNDQQQLNTNAQECLRSAQCELEQLTSLSKNYLVKIFKLETDLYNTQEKLRATNELTQKLELLENENCRLQKTIFEQDSLIGPFRAHLQAYEMEYSVLMNEKKNAQNEAKEMGLKYAQILGHQNQKQKIKHLTDLKIKNLELSEEKQKLELKIRSQARTIELLKSQTTPKKSSLKDKENINSSNLSMNSSRIDSPGSRLKERN